MFSASLILAAAGAAISPTPSDFPSKQGKAEVRAAFDRKLFDGTSARYLFEPAKSDDFVCVWVNAKNRMGAFTGWTVYIVSKSKAGEVSISDSDVMTELFCGEAGEPSQRAKP